VNSPEGYIIKKKKEKKGENQNAAAMKILFPLFNIPYPFSFIAGGKKIL
jgi:hypothetical protein